MPAPPGVTGAQVKATSPPDTSSAAEVDEPLGCGMVNVMERLLVAGSAFGYVMKMANTDPLAELPPPPQPVTARIRTPLGVESRVRTPRIRRRP